MTHGEKDLDQEVAAGPQRAFKRVQKHSSGMNQGCAYKGETVSRKHPEPPNLGELDPRQA